MSLRRQLIRLAHEQEDLRPYLLPVLKKYGRLPPAGIRVPKDVYLRAGRRWLDAIDRKGFQGAVRATEIRIDRIKPGSEKAQGIAEYLKMWVREEKLRGAEKAAVQRLISQAEDKAQQFV